MSWTPGDDIRISLTCGCMIIYSPFNDNYREPWVEFCWDHTRAEQAMNRGKMLDSGEVIRDQIFKHCGRVQ